jgi:esterase/lipase superfamily enzyme
MVALVALWLAPSIVASQATPDAQLILKGSVTRVAAGTGQQPTPVRDAIVEFVSVSGLTPLQQAYHAIASTVSDKDGNYELILGTLDPAKTYAVRSRGVGDVWTINQLGTGAEVGKWLKTTDITLGKTSSVREQVTHGAIQAYSDSLNAEAQRNQLEQKHALLRSQMDALQGQKVPPAPPGAIQQQQAQIDQNAAAMSQNSAQQAQADELNQRAQQLQANEQTDTALTGFGVKRVFFATDRGINVKASTIEITNSQNSDGKMRLGVCEVAVQKQGEGADNLLRLISDADSDRYYSIQSISLSQDSDWWEQVKAAMKAAHNGDVLLFVHGYNVSFADGCRRAAQLAYDIKFTGPIMLYSWPSSDTFLGYGKDETSAAWSTEHFVGFLKQVLDATDLGHLHIIAHSMGNRIVTDGLLSDKITKTERARLGEIVLAAADVDRKKFHQQYDLPRVGAMRITMYASNRDQALLASKIFHGFVRLGEVKPDIEVKAGMDSIDASAVDTGFLGHSYFGDSPSVVDDLSPLIVSYTDPEHRHSDILQGHAPDQWWMIHP